MGTGQNHATHIVSKMTSQRCALSRAHSSRFRYYFSLFCCTSFTVKQQTSY